MQADVRLGQALYTGAVVSFLIKKARAGREMLKTRGVGVLYGLEAAAEVGRSIRKILQLENW